MWASHLRTGRMSPIEKLAPNGQGYTLPLNPCLGTRINRIPLGPHYDLPTKIPLALIVAQLDALTLLIIAIGHDVGNPYTFVRP